MGERQIVWRKDTRPWGEGGARKMAKGIGARVNSLRAFP